MRSKKQKFIFTAKIFYRKLFAFLTLVNRFFEWYIIGSTFLHQFLHQVFFFFTPFFSQNFGVKILM